MVQTSVHLHLFQQLHPLLLLDLLVRSAQSLHPSPNGFWICTDNTTVSSHLGLLVLNVRQWPFCRYGIWIFKNENLADVASASVLEWKKTVVWNPHADFHGKDGPRLRASGLRFRGKRGKQWERKQH